MLAFLIGAHVCFWTIFLANLVYLRRAKFRPCATSHRPPVSILIPARNEALNLPRLLDSILAQDYPEKEIIVYDDGSEDETASILNSYKNQGVKSFRGSGPPEGWMGKVHALFQATRHAQGELMLFLDADVQLRHPEALEVLVERFYAHPESTVLTVLPELRGGGLLQVSLVPHTILTALPWPLVRLLPFSSLGALNGQAWLISATDYRRLEPHQAVKNEILEDVLIGRYLKRNGLVPVLYDAKDDLTVFMYRSMGEAWRGFRKNAYLLAGGRFYTFLPLFVFYFLAFTASVVFSPWLLLSLYLLKAATDRFSRFPFWVSLLAPLSFLLGSVLQLDSAISHWSGRVAWKGRSVLRSPHS